MRRGPGAPPFGRGFQTSQAGRSTTTGFVAAVQRGGQAERFRGRMQHTEVKVGAVTAAAFLVVSCARSFGANTVYRVVSPKVRKCFLTLNLHGLINFGPAAI